MCRDLKTGTFQNLDIGYGLKAFLVMAVMELFPYFRMDANTNS